MYSALSTCTEYSCAKTKEYTIITWPNQNWTFSGFAIGPNSGDHYHLMRNPTERECAILRETKDGTIQWIKYYALTPCRAMVIHPSETN